MALKLKKGLDSTVRFFESDDDFYQFCVIPELKVKEYVDNNGNIQHYTDFEFSDEYLEAVEAGVSFVIKDEDSKIYKRKAVSYRTITKKVKNLKGYFGTIKGKILYEKD